MLKLQLFFCKYRQNYSETYMESKGTREYLIQSWKKIRWENLLDFSTYVATVI